MDCLVCGTVLKVNDSVSHGRDVYRRRKCPKCGTLHYTKEVIIPATSADLKNAFYIKVSENKDKRKREKRALLYDSIGKLVRVTFMDGDIESGVLGYTREYSAKYNYRMPNRFTLGDIDFRISHVRKIEVLED